MNKNIENFLNEYMKNPDPQKQAYEELIVARLNRLKNYCYPVKVFLKNKLGLKLYAAVVLSLSSTSVTISSTRRR